MIKAENLIVIIGPSGVGKSTIVHKLLETGDFVLHPTWTTRPARSQEEIALKDHIFVSDEEFDNKIQKNEFLDVVKLFNLPYRYSIPVLKFNTTKVNILMSRASLIQLLEKYYFGFKIYQIEGPITRAITSLEQRSDPNHGSRLKDFNKEISDGRKLADRIFINEGKIENIVSDVCRSCIMDITISN